MKRLLLITLLAVAVFAGCEVEDADSDRDDRRTEEANDDRGGAGEQAADLSDDLDDDAPASVDDLDQETVEMLFLSVLRDQEPVFAGIPDDLVLETAHATCEALDAGVSFEEIAATGIAEGSFTTAELGAMTGASVAAFCPEYEDEMRDYADRWS